MPEVEAVGTVPEEAALPDELLSSVLTDAGGKIRAICPPAKKQNENDRIEELYGVKLRLVDDDAPDANYNFSFQKDTPIEDVIELLQFISGTRFEILRYPDSD